MNFLAVLTPSSIYHGCSTRKTFWEVNFTLGEFTDVNMKNCGRHNVRKHKEINGGDKCVALEISLKFGSLDNTRITYSDPKENLVRSVKGLITFLGIKAKEWSKKYKKARYAIVNYSMKDLSKTIREFEKLPYNSYVRRRLKHEPTDSYFYLAR